MRGAAKVSVRARLVAPAPCADAPFRGLRVVTGPLLLAPARCGRAR